MKGIHDRTGCGMAETFLCSRHFLDDELRTDRERVAARPGTDAADLTWHEIPNIPDRFCTVPHEPSGSIASLVSSSQLHAPQTYGYVNNEVADLRRTVLHRQAMRR